MTSYPSSALTTRSSSVSPSRHGYHSPVRHSGSSPVIQKNAASSPGSPGNRMYHNSPPRQNYMSELETATIHRQRRELQLLIAELQDRDRELNEMVHAHQKQMIAWEEDRQRILALEQRNSRLDAEIRGKAEQVKHLTGRLKLIETQEQSKTCALETTQKQLEKMSEKASSSTMQLQDLEGRNMSLNSTIREVSSQLGQLEAREQELITMLKLKDKDLLEASNHISEITGKLKRLDTMYREYRQSDLNSKKDLEDWKQRHGDLKAENDRLRGELGVSSTNST
uniref:Coiled-coil domain-containing protein 62-like n=1 Tax=Saccoglossus kowalevskii TaxID=10224 RepID=A0ABM0LTN9_SACKO|nr:PREDICTED: coiled-coil domain-containing protein 62-like [Saccoglossus kowalevskii]